MLLDDPATLFRTALVALLVYAGLVAMLRLAGKRAIAKMNAFDLVVTVALGSTLATTLLSRQTSLAQGLVALATLLVLQFLIAQLSTRWSKFRGIVVAEPRLLVHKGRLLKDQMHKERLAEEEVLAAVRSGGYASLEQVDAVVLETDGTLSVIGATDKPPTAMTSVKGHPAAKQS